MQDISSAASIGAIAQQCGFTIVDTVTLPERRAIFSEVPHALDAKVQSLLRAKFVNGLYSHQAESIKLALQGEDICLATATASGKSDVFISVALDLLLKNQTATVLAFYPARALIQDQLEKWTRALAHIGYEPGYIDGGVPVGDRYGILQSRRVVLMTPDVAHAWLMSNLARPEIGGFLTDLRLLILDEAHVYEGVFGTNTAYLLRRFQAAAAPHQTIYSTATLDDAAGFVEQLAGKRVRVFGPKEDGSYNPEKTIVLTQMSRDFTNMADLLSELARSWKGRFLAFADSRKEVELLVAAASRAGSGDQEDSSPEGFGDLQLPKSILPYRAGYENKDRVAIQKALAEGRVSGVVSTSAMELGLDIGDVDLVVMLTTPPSVKSFWQRLGRAGRRQAGTCIILDDQGAVSVHGLQKYLSRPVEPNCLYLDNRSIQYINALCATKEVRQKGISSDCEPFCSLPPSFKRFVENELNPTEPVPDDLFLLKQRGESDPHHEFYLRSGAMKQFNVMEKGWSSAELGSLAFSQVLREAYPGAVYYYMARPYRVEYFNFRDGQIWARRTKYFTTEPITEAMVFPKFAQGVLSAWRTDDGFLSEVELQVSERVTGFKERKGSAKPEAHYYGPGSPYYQSPLTRFFRTTGVCWHFPEKATATPAIAELILDAFCMEFGVLKRDVGVGRFFSKSSPCGGGPETGICIYDAAEGSLRLTQKLAENFLAVLGIAQSLLKLRGEESSPVFLDIGTFIQAASHLRRDTSHIEVYPAEAIEEWIEVIKDGEPGMMVTAGKTVQVNVIGHKYTRQGLMYDLHDAKLERWTVPARTVQPIFGTTRTLLLNPDTLEERSLDQQPSSGDLD